MTDAQAPPAFPGLALLGPEACAAALPYDALIEALAQGFAAREIAQAPRQHFNPSPGRELLLGTAWRAGGALGLKALTLFRDNPSQGHPQIQGTYTLFDGHHGAPRALLDAGTLTARRTAATSALAARHLARPDATHLLVLGTGRLARALPEAFLAVRPLKTVTIWGRRADAVAATLDDLRAALPGLRLQAASTLEAAVTEADMVTSALPSTAPVLRGAWLKAGQHVDLVGSYGPAMAEADGACLQRARVFVDTHAGGRAEAGELLQAVAAGTFTWDAVAGDLGDLAAGQAVRHSADEITLFKAVGSAQADLIAAELALSRWPSP